MTDCSPVIFCDLFDKVCDAY